ncbi:MAG: hypothetical protein OXB89_08785 [Anaerolineaceae bacterium]|nr:hypothetical protein [Anaerolineaceae bacterium]
MSELLPFPAGGRRNLRMLLFVVILATAPLYCIGFVLWGVAPGAQPAATATPRPSATLRLGTATATRTNTPFRSVIVTATRPLPPTPRQFRPPAQQPETGQQPQQQQQPDAQPQPDSALPVVPAPVQQPVTRPEPEVTETAVPIQFRDDDDE